MNKKTDIWENMHEISHKIFLDLTTQETKM